MAYARQAQSDFQTFERMQGTSGISECHRLHFLQMACEKLAKAHLCEDGADPIQLQSSHAYIAKTLPIVIRQQILASGKQIKATRWVVEGIKPIAREIELLAPAVKRGGQRPDNCEYPWEDTNGNLHTPRDWTFMPTQLLAKTQGRTFLKLVYTSISRLAHSS